MLKGPASMEIATLFPHSQNQREYGFALAIACEGGLQSASPDAAEEFNLVLMQISFW